MTHKPHMTLPNGEKLYEGEYGITRDGDRVGPLMCRDAASFPWIVSGSFRTADGKYYIGKTTRFDIIARAEPTISLDTLESLTTPVGLLDDATRKALEDHGGPYEVYAGDWRDNTLLGSYGYVYRVKKQPKVETVKRSVHNGNSFVGYIAIDKINGEYDLTTVRPWVEGEE